MTPAGDVKKLDGDAISALQLSEVIQSLDADDLVFISVRAQDASGHE